MPMVHVENLDRVHGCLAEASGLSDQLAARRHDFAVEVGRWLVRLEEAAKEACPAAVPQLAALRTAVEAAAQGLDVPDVGGHRTRRKARSAAAQEALRTAVALVSAAVEPFEARRRRAEDIALTVAARSFEKGLWPGQRQESDAPRDMPSMWRALLADPDLGSLTMEMSALLGFPQSMALVAQTMTEFAGGAANRKPA